MSEGFLRWRVSPVVRRLLTRMLGLIPSMVVAIAVGRPGIDALLVVSQVVLSITLPFITLPLILLTSSKAIMRVEVAREVGPEEEARGIEPAEEAKERDSADVERTAETEYRDFSNSKIAMVVGSLIWLLIACANVYVIVELALGRGG